MFMLQFFASPIQYIIETQITRANQLQRRPYSWSRANLSKDLFRPIASEGKDPGSKAR